MEKKTIAQVAMDVLTTAKQPMSAAEITQVMLDKELYSFKAKDPKAMVKSALERRCEGVDRKNVTQPFYFSKSTDGKYRLKS